MKHLDYTFTINSPCCNAEIIVEQKVIIYSTVGFLCFDSKLEPFAETPHDRDDVGREKYICTNCQKAISKTDIMNAARKEEKRLLSKIKQNNA